MSYFLLKSVGQVYFQDTNNLYPINKTKQILFSEPINLQDVSDEWVAKLNKEDKKLIQKDLKKFKKI